MAWIPQVQEPPVSPFTSVAPLVFVVTMTMLKQGYEDFKRHRADRVINQRKVTKLQNGGVIEIQAQEVKCNQLIISTISVTLRYYPNMCRYCNIHLDKGRRYIMPNGWRRVPM